VVLGLQLVHELVKLLDVDRGDHAIILAGADEIVQGVRIDGIELAEDLACGLLKRAVTLVVTEGLLVLKVV